MCLNEITLEEYSELSPKNRLNYLLESFDIDKPILRGRVKEVNKERDYLFIGDIKSTNGLLIYNPFENNSRIRDVYVPLKDPKVRDKILCQLEDNELVQFEFVVKRGKNTEKDKLINGNPKSLKRIISLDPNLKKDGQIEKLEELFNKDEDFNDYKIIIDKDINNKIEELLNGYKINKSKLEQDVQEITNDIEKLSNKKNEIELDIEKNKLDIKKIETTRGNYVKMGLLSDNKPEKEHKQEVVDIGEYSIPKAIQIYLANRNDKKLFYCQEIIEQFYVSLFSNQLIILNGKPGTGKTSLVEGMADAIGAECRTISVRPNWSDAQDLLGYYNPIDKIYMGTHFLDALIQANNDLSTLYFICLDEMNLSCIEYYFSDFLSKLYSNEQSIQLYSKNVVKDIYEEIQLLVEKYIPDISVSEDNLKNKMELIKSKDIELYIKAKKTLNNIEKYPPIINIPSNVRFIGTLNKDESTKNISPKVIDRSFIITLNEEDKMLKIEKNNNIKIRLDPNRFCYKNEIVFEQLKPLNTIIDVFKKIGLDFNNRNKLHASMILSNDFIDRKNLIDYIIADKILPKINMDVDNDIESKIDDIEKTLKKYKVSSQIFNDMKVYCDKYSLLTYWR